MLRISVANRKDEIKIKGQIFERQQVPSSVTVLHGHGGPGLQGDVLKGYYEAEQKQGTKFKSEFKPDEIKKAWSTPYDK
jgi:hypothetical protein